MKCVFLGMGAIGSLYAVNLYLNGVHVVGILRGENYNCISKKGLYFESLSGQQIHIPIDKRFQVYKDVRTAKSLLESLEDGDWIIISSKAYSTESIFKEFMPYIEKLGYVLLLQNGIGNEEIIKKILPSIMVYRASTTNGAYLSSPGYVKHTGSGFTKIGIPVINSEKGLKVRIDNALHEKRINRLIEVLNKSLAPTSFEKNIDIVLWEKIFINIGINALASIKNIQNGELLKSDILKEQMRTAIKEAWQIAAKINNGFPNDPDYYYNMAVEVAQKTAKNFNSMLQDIKYKRPTEIDFINGKIVEYANKLGLDVPVNRDLTLKIKLIEKNYEK